MISIKNIILNNFRNYKNAEVNLSQDNGVFFIYGDNGAGKSTLMNAIAGVFPMDEGQIIEQGPPSEIFDNPHNERLRSFLSKVL